MADHGILFSSEMVRSLLARRKRVTRRMPKRWLKVKRGDSLWVRETWRTGSNLDPHSANKIATMSAEAGFTGGLRAPVWYEADGFHAQWSDTRDQDINDFGEPGKARPSIFCPRWASRISLIATEDARLERLQDITEDEARMEGVEQYKESGLYSNYGDVRLPALLRSPRLSFKTLWSTLHTKPGERFEDNPELVVIPFDYPEATR